MPNNWTGRKAPKDGPDYYPTPAYVTHALMELISGFGLAGQTCLEPAAGGGHMVDVLCKYFRYVEGSDIHDPDGRGWTKWDFTDYEVDPFDGKKWDWCITNPPFIHSDDFVWRMLDRARKGVAIINRLNWVEGRERYRKLFRDHPPSVIAVFPHRIPFIPGKTGTVPHAWFVWVAHLHGEPTRFEWMPDNLTPPAPGAKSSSGAGTGRRA